MEQQRIIDKLETHSDIKHINDFLKTDLFKKHYTRYLQSIYKNKKIN